MQDGCLIKPYFIFTIRRGKTYDKMYRNIDDDARLLNMTKRYWSEDQLTKEQVYWVLKSEGYSEREIDNAISDYYAIHLRSDIMLHHFIAPVVLVIIMIVLILKVYSLLK